MSRFGLVLFVMALPVAAGASRPKHLASTCTEREPCRKACAAGDVGACFALGQQLLVKGSGGAGRDPAGASGAFLSACEKGHAAACLELGRMRTQGLGGPVDVEAAAAASREACNRGLEPACAVVALNALFATGQRRDPGLAHALAKRSEAATRKGCAGKDGMLCALLAEMADAGLIAGGAAASHDFYEQARKLLEPRCAREDGIACLWLGKGESQAGTSALRRACDLGVARACSAVGSRLLYGLGVDRDAAQAIASWKTACGANDRWACHALCTRLWSGQSVTRDETAARPFCDRALSLTTRSCDLGSGEGCATLALFYQEGVSVPVDRTRATSLYAASVESLRSECAAHRSSACAFLIRLYGHGPGVPKDLPAMLEAERLGCASGAASACLLYAERLRSGDLVERSNERAKFYDEQACDLGNTAGCTSASMSPTIAQRQPSPPVSCPPDQKAEEDSPNHCCFARQVWSDKERRCLGDPLCPEGTVAQHGTCRATEPGDDPRESGEPDGPSATAAVVEPASEKVPSLRQANVEQPKPTSAPPANDCSSCAADCASLTARCQSSMPACYESSACLCRCQRDHGGCGMPLAALDQCISDNTAQSSRLSQSERSDQAK